MLYNTRGTYTCRLLNFWHTGNSHDNILSYMLIHTSHLTSIVASSQSPIVSCISIPLSRLSATLNPIIFTLPTTENSTP